MSFYKIFKSKKDIEILIVAYSFNFFIPALILIISSFLNQNELAAELGLIGSLSIFLTQLFSLNARSVIISEKDKNLLKKFLLFRLATSLPIIFFMVFIINYFLFNNRPTLIYLSFLIILQWVFELILFYYENTKKKKYIYSYISFSLLFLIIFFFNMNIALVFYNIFIILLIFKFLPKIFSILKLKHSIFDILKIKFFSYYFFSSFGNSASNLFWRVFIYYSCDKILAGIYFSSFAIGSFHGTLFNISYGPTILRNNIKFIYNRFFVKYFFYLIFFILLIIFIFILKINVYESNYKTIQIITILMSVIGSFFMIEGQKARQSFIQKKNKKIFLWDCVYYFIIMLIVPTLFIFNSKFLMYSFLVSSLISYYFYKFFLIKKLYS